MIQISLCMIVKNEQPVLERCLTYARRLCDQLIVIDTGSTDETVAIAGRYADYVGYFPWCDDFSAARNYAASFAVHTHCMWLDADDVMDEENIHRFLQFKEAATPDVDCMVCIYRNEPEKLYSDQCYRERVLKKEYFTFEHHNNEYIVIRGSWNTIWLRELVIEHRKVRVNEPERCNRIYDSMLARGEQLTDLDRFYYGRALMNKSRQEALNYLEKWSPAVGTPFLSEYVMLRCVLLKSLGRAQEAAELARWALTWGVERAYLYCFSAAGYAQAGDYTQALSQYQKALSLPAYPPDTKLDLTHYHEYHAMQGCIQCYAALGEIRKALEMNGEFLKRYPQSVAAQVNQHKLEQLAT